MAVAELLEKAHSLGDAEKNELIVGVVEKMTVLGLSNLVKAIETKFDVKASGGGMMMAMPMAGGGGAAPPEEVEKTEFDLVLKDAGQKKIAVIKEVRGITNLNLKDAKELVDKAPVTIKPKMSKDEAEKAKAVLEEAGAVIEIK
ncbi:MAG: 50S ribosomal protein L7/L12 [Planctomycetota bacterium]|nr:50S ribosomal protein L7/L12 [Planctomycetota bacterium]